MRKKSTRDGDVKYLIRWKGYSSAYDSWEAAEDVSEEAIEEFDDAKLNGPAKEPYVVTIAPDSIIAPNVADGLVSEWLDDVARKAAGLLSRQREEWACRKLFQMSPCPSWVFCALHRACTAHEASGAGAVSAIYSVKGGRGGKFVEDQFDMVSTDLVSALVGKYNSKGHGALVVRDNKTAVMLVPPLEFKFRARRQADADGRAWPHDKRHKGERRCQAPARPRRTWPRFCRPSRVSFRCGDGGNDAKAGRPSAEPADAQSLKNFYRCMWCDSTFTTTNSTFTTTTAARSHGGKFHRERFEGST